MSAFNFDMMPENQSTKRAKQELRDALPMTESDAFGKFHVCLRCSSNALTCYGQGMNSGNVLTCVGAGSDLKLQVVESAGTAACRQPARDASLAKGRLGKPNNNASISQCQSLVLV